MKILAVVVLIFGIFGCRSSISEKEKDWMPYSQGDKIYFNSTNGKTDSVLINDVELVDPVGLPRLISTQSLWVFATSYDSITTAFDYRRVKRENKFVLIGIKSGNPLFNNMEISINIYNFDFLGKVTELESLRKDSLLIQNKLFRNVYVLENTYQFHLYNPEDIVKVYWMREIGLVGYKQQNGNTWVLRD